MRNIEQKKIDEVYETCVVLFEEIGVKLEQLRILTSRYKPSTIDQTNSNSPLPIPSEIVALVCDTLTQRVEEVKGNKRYSELCEARYISSKLIREIWPTITLKEIGHAIGREDHTTVIHSIKEADDRYFDDPAFKIKYDKCEFELMKKINNKLINKIHDNETEKTMG